MGPNFLVGPNYFLWTEIFSRGPKCGPKWAPKCGPNWCPVPCGSEVNQKFGPLLKFSKHAYKYEYF